MNASHTDRAPSRWIALLGKQDQPTDALADYCERLRHALAPRGYSLDCIRFEWPQHGWRGAWKKLERQLAGRAGEWVLVQYTHLAWSQRGFPVRFPWLVRRLQGTGMRVLVVFHDPGVFGGSRLRDRLRRAAQLWSADRAAQAADKIVTTISPERFSWMHDAALRGKITAIPVGSNLPVPALPPDEPRNSPLTVAVFTVTESQVETPLIAEVAQRAAREYGPFRLAVFGRGAAVAAEMLRPFLAGSGVDLEGHGILPPGECAALLARADVQLFLRSGVSSRRGSAIAGISLGLPLVGFSGDETAPPITEAGVRLVPEGDVDGAVRELVSVLRDGNLRRELRDKSLDATRGYFSWDRIAEQYIAALNSPVSSH